MNFNENQIIHSGGKSVMSLQRDENSNKISLIGFDGSLVSTFTEYEITLLKSTSIKNLLKIEESFLNEFIEVNMDNKQLIELLEILGIEDPKGKINWSFKWSPILLLIILIQLVISLTVIENYVQEWFYFYESMVSFALMLLTVLYIFYSTILIHNISNIHREKSMKMVLSSLNDEKNDGDIVIEKDMRQHFTVRLIILSILILSVLLIFFVNLTTERLFIVSILFGTLLFFKIQ